VAARFKSLPAVLAADPALPAKLREGCAALAEALGDDQAEAVRAVRWVVSGGRDGAAWEQPGLLQYLVWSAAAPALAPVLAAFAAAEPPRWDHAHCPTCGAQPLMAWLMPGDGVRERRLVCGCCGTRWSFQRIGCACCGSTDPAKLSILEAEGEGGLRLDLCDECRSYTKTFAGDGDPALLLADWTSLHLDVLACGRGYQRNGTSLYAL
jgi:FdhE protein